MLSYPDYDKSIINLISSIRRYYHTPAAYENSSVLNSFLTGDYKNVVVLVVSGLGKEMLENVTHREGYLYNHMISTLTSVFPSARTAAFTSMITGLSPNEHGWLGHNLFFKEFSRTISLFSNYDAYTHQMVASTNVANFMMPHENIFDDIARSKTANVQPFTISQSGFPIAEKGNIHKTADTMKRLFEIIELIGISNQRTFTFAYWNEITELSRVNGINSEAVRNTIFQLEENLQRISSRLMNTLFIVTADHGMTEISGEYQLHNNRKLMNCLSLPPQMEGRAMSFFVKQNMQQEFKELFEKSYHSDFVLLSTEDTRRQRLFGFGIPHPKFGDFMGDYIACGISDKALRYMTLNEKPKPVQSASCGGITDAEMIVPLIIL